MRTSTVLAGLVALGVIAAPLAAADSPSGSLDPRESPSGDLSPKDEARLALGLQLAAYDTGLTGANPFLGFLPSVQHTDFRAWRQEMARRSAARAADTARLDAARAAAMPGGRVQSPLVYREKEAPGTAGANDTTWLGEKVGGFGLGAGKRNRMVVRGGLADNAPTARSLPTPREDNGSLSLAADTGIRGNARVRVTGTLGDGPHGASGDKKGDFDWFKLQTRPGETIVVDPAGTRPDHIVIITDAAGAPVAVTFGAGEVGQPAYFRPPDAGTYYVAIWPLDSIQLDPHDSGSGAGSTQAPGPYTLTIGSWKADRDAVLVYLRKGDVLGASVAGNARGVAVQKWDSTYVAGIADMDLSGAFPAASPLPGGGNATASYVTEESGWYGVIAERGVGAYANTVEVYRPGGESDPKAGVQRVYLDFDGATIDPAIVHGPAGTATLSPLSAFLANWGMTRSQLKPLMAQITRTATENLRADAIAHGLNPNVKVEIVNGSTSPDVFGKPGVSRVIVGGTIAESGIETIGIAQYIDPGNYSRTDTALVLLDTISAPVEGNPRSAASLNYYLRPGTDRVRFVGTAIGNIVSHEVGHYIGNWHTYNGNSVASMMDSGGRAYWRMFQTGPDKIPGTADDGDLDFATDRYALEEGIFGVEDTLNVSAWAFAGGRR